MYLCEVRKNVEIMAPVGSLESLHAAIQGGADSVYFGTGRLNMRSRSSKNFGPEDLGIITDICRKNSILTRLTLNTVIYDSEIAEAIEILKLAKEFGVNAIIASDLSVIIKAHEMGLNVHISTQCNITNVEAVKFYSKYADVMVLARELSLEQIQFIIDEIKRLNICGPSGKHVEIEVFAHGAMCMAVSGKCYLSQDIECFSANRGACLQLCRRSYTLTDYETGEKLKLDNGYILSPKDLCTIEFLDKILDSGVKVLKIEGRGRSADYVKTVTKCYREAANDWQNAVFNSENAKKWIEKLKTVYNRGFWEGYYFGKTRAELSGAYGSQATKTKTYVGKVTNYFSRIKVAEVLLEAGNLSIGNEIIISGETTGIIEETLREMRLDDLNQVQKIEKGQVFSIPVTNLVRRGDKVYRLDISAQRA